MNKNFRLYRILVAGGMFLTALSLTATLVCDRWALLFSSALLFCLIAVYGTWHIWPLGGNKPTQSARRSVYSDPVARSLATALSGSYLKGIDGLSDGEQVFVSSYITLAILFATEQKCVFNKATFCDLLLTGCEQVFKGMQQSMKAPLTLVWELEPIDICDVLSDGIKIQILDSAATKIVSKLKISE